MALNALNKKFYTVFKYTLGVANAENIFLGRGSNGNWFFSTIKHCLFQSKEIFTWVWDVHKRERTGLLKNLAHALKDILHMVISNDIPLKISLSYGCVSLVKRVTFLCFSEIE